jgi:hypothetical protein
MDAGAPVGIKLRTRTSLKLIYNLLAKTSFFRSAKLESSEISWTFCGVKYVAEPG